MWTAENALPPLRHVRPPHEVVEGDVIGISQNNHYGNRRNYFTVFIILIVSFGHTGRKCSLFLCDLESLAKALESIRKWHANTSKMKMDIDTRYIA